MAFPVMHPQMALRIAEDRAAELAAAAAAARRARAFRRRRGVAIRRRVGWALVSLGLRLALTPERPVLPGRPLPR